MTEKVLCPAGAEVHPVLSPNILDVVCRIQGGLRPASADGKPAICCADYDRCQIWRIHKEIENGPSQRAQRQATRSEQQRHTLQHASRDSVFIS